VDSSANFIEREEAERFGETIDQLILFHRKAVRADKPGSTSTSFAFSEEPNPVG
jgi:hypothetical protein